MSHFTQPQTTAMLASSMPCAFNLLVQCAHSKGLDLQQAMGPCHRWPTIICLSTRQMLQFPYPSYLRGPMPAPPKAALEMVSTSFLRFKILINYLIRMPRRANRFTPALPDARRAPRLCQESFKKRHLRFSSCFPSMHTLQLLGGPAA